MKAWIIMGALAAQALWAQTVPSAACDEKDLAPVKGPSPYGPRKVEPPDHDLPADPLPEPVHAGVSLEVWHPSTENFRVGGLALLSNGNMLELDYDGKLYLVSGLSSAATVTRKALPGPGYPEPLGLLVRGDTGVYVLTSTTLYGYRFDGTTLSGERTVLKVPVRGGWYGWNGDMLADSTHLYCNLGTRGSIGRYAFATGKWDLDYATAMRNSHGLGRDLMGGIWLSDNQGNYRPASPIFVLKPGKDYGVPTAGWTSGAANWQGSKGPDPVVDAFKSDMIWLPYDRMSHSATDIHFLRSGPFRGQGLVGDNRTGHLNRIIPDTVDGQVQGAALRFTGGLEAGNYRIVEDARGTLWLGNLGNPANRYWAWCGKTGGFQKLSFKPGFLGSAAYNDVLGVRLTRDGLILSFTSDIADAYLDAANYRAYTFSYLKSISPYYGGTKSDSAGARITGIQRRSSREVLIAVEGLHPESLLGLEFGKALTQGLHLQPYEIFYTMNRISNKAATAITPAGRTAPAPEVRIGAAGRRLFLRGAFGSLTAIGLSDPAGRSVPGFSNVRPAADGSFDVAALRPGLYIARGRAGDRPFAAPFLIR